MRPVVVCQTTEPGGAERYLTTLYGGLRDRGHRPLLIGNVPGWTEEGLPVQPAPLGDKWGGRRTLKLLPRLPGERLAVTRLVDANLDDEVTAFHVQFKREQIGLTDRLADRAPVLWTEHGRFKTGVEARLQAVAYAQAARRAATIVCVSGAVADDVRRVVGARAPVQVIPNAIDTTAVRPPSPAAKAAARDALGIPQSAQVAAWVSRADPGKLPMLAAAAGQGFSGLMMMAGSGSQEAELRADAGSNVRVLGQVADPAQVFDAADVFLFTSVRQEGYPTNSMLEAAAHGLPIVTNASAGAGRVLADAGAIVAADDPAALAAALDEACADGDRGRASRSWAERHDKSAWLDQYEDVLSGLWSHWRYALV